MKTASVISLTTQGLGCLYALWKDETIFALLAGFGMLATVRAWQEDTDEKRKQLSGTKAGETLDDLIARAKAA